MGGDSARRNDLSEASGLVLRCVRHRPKLNGGSSIFRCDAVHIRSFRLGLLRFERFRKACMFLVRTNVDDVEHPVIKSQGKGSIFPVCCATVDAALTQDLAGVVATLGPWRWQRVGDFLCEAKRPHVHVLVADRRRSPVSIRYIISFPGDAVPYSTIVLERYLLWISQI